MGVNPTIAALCRAHGLPEPETEVRFHPERKWRFDLLFPGKVAVEIQGGIFTRGRHVRGAALLREYEKINTAQIMGYKVLLVTPQQMNDGSAFALVAQALKGDWHAELHPPGKYRCGCPLVRSDKVKSLCPEHLQSFEEVPQ